MLGKTALSISISGLTLALVSCASHRGAQGTPEASADTNETTHTTHRKAREWPDSLEAVAAAPPNHKVLLENNRVRVLEVTVRSHEKEPLHFHRWPSVMYVMSGGHFRDYNELGEVAFDSRTVQELPKLPLTTWDEPLAPHAIENLSDEPIHLIRVELKR